jgi:hypothetical protein
LYRKFLLKHIIEAKKEEKVNPLVDKDDARSYWMTLRKTEDTGNEERALDRNLWRTRFGRCYGFFIRKTRE